MTAKSRGGGKGTPEEQLIDLLFKAMSCGFLYKELPRWREVEGFGALQIQHCADVAGEYSGEILESHCCIPMGPRALRPRATMPQPPLPSSGTSAISAVPAGSDKIAAPKGITANPRLAKFLRLLQPQQRRPPPDWSAEDSLFSQTEERLSQKEAPKSGARGSLKRATVAAALANVRLRDRVREAAGDARAAHDSSSTPSSSDFEPSLAHKSRLQVKPGGHLVTGKQQLREAVEAHAEAKGSRSHGSLGRSQAPKESRLAEQTEKVKASAVAEAKKVVRHAKDKSAKPQAVMEQAAKDTFIVFSALCFLSASPRACCWCRVPAACF